jgi:hypothetical protein
LRFLGITFYVLALFIFSKMYATDAAAVRIIFAGYTLAAGLNVLAVLVGFFGVELPLPVLAFSVRAVGFFKDSNVYGPFIVIAVLWIFDQVVSARVTGPKAKLLLIYGVILASGVVLSLSRAAMINLAVAGVIYAVLLAREFSWTQVRPYLLYAVLTMAVVFLIIQLVGLGEVIWLRWQYHDYDVARFEFQRQGILAGLSSPIGLGPGGLPNAHSLYIRTFAEQGILGLTALVMVIGGLLWPLAKSAWQGEAENTLLPKRLMVALMVGLLVNSLVIDSIHWRHFWVVLGLAWAIQANPEA